MVEEFSRSFHLFPLSVLQKKILRVAWRSPIVVNPIWRRPKGLLFLYKLCSTQTGTALDLPVPHIYMHGRYGRWITQTGQCTTIHEGPGIPIHSFVQEMFSLSSERIPHDIQRHANEQTLALSSIEAQHVRKLCVLFLHAE